MIARPWAVAAAMLFAVRISAVGQAPVPSETPAPTAAHPDLSGTWTLDQSKSDVGGAVGAAPRGRRGEAIAAARIVITQTTESLVIEQHVGQGGVHTLTYRLDGAESTNPGPRGGEIKSKSEWQGATLATQSTQTLTTGAGQVTLETKEIRSIDSDGSMVVARESTDFARA